MIGNKIKEIRRSKKITQIELSEKTGVSISYIQQLEYGKKKNPSLEVLKLISEALEVNISDLTELYENKSVEDNIQMYILDKYVDERYSGEIKEILEKAITRFSEKIEDTQLDERDLRSLIDDSYKYIEFLFYTLRK